MAEEKIYPFEEALEKLSALVEKMESGDLSLEESLKMSVPRYVFNRWIICINYQM